MNRYLLFASQSYSYAILRPLQQAIRARGDTAAWYLHNVADQLDPSREHRLQSIADVKTYTPHAVFVPGNWVPDFFPGAKVEVFHGFGIEKKGHFRIRGWFDLYCTHGPATTRPFQELAQRHNYFKVAETGWPKMDPLFAYSQAQEWRTRHHVSGPVILYAPTFSPSLGSAPALRDTIQSLSTRAPWHWLVKFHPKMDPKTRAAYRALQGPHLTVSDDDEIIPLLHVADIMLSDTSSVVAESLMLNKPVVTFRAQQPGPHVLNITRPDALEAALQQGLQHPAPLLRAAREFIDNMHPYRDGHSSERVLQATDHFLAHDFPHLPRKPLNIWRKLQIRQRMGYYHLR